MGLKIEESHTTDNDSVEKNKVAFRKCKKGGPILSEADRSLLKHPSFTCLLLPLSAHPNLPCLGLCTCVFTLPSLSPPSGLNSLYFLMHFSPSLLPSLSLSLVYPLPPTLLVLSLPLNSSRQPLSGTRLFSFPISNRHLEKDVRASVPLETKLRNIVE